MRDRLASARLTESIFLVFVAAVPVMQPLTRTVGGHNVVVADAIFIALAFACVLAAVRASHAVVLHAWHASLCAFVCACALSTAFSTDSRASLLKLMGVLYLTSVGFIASQFVRDPSMLRRIVVAWMAGAVVTIAAAAAGVAMFYAGYPANPLLYSYGSLIPGPYPRVMALFLNANMLCSYILASAVIALAAVRADWLPARFGYSLAGACVVTACLTLSPGIGGLAIVAAICAASMWRKRRPVLARAVSACGLAIAGLLLMATTVSPVTFARGRTFWDAVNHLEASSRFQTWRGALDTVLLHPWLGAGPGLPVAHVAYLNASGGSESLTDAHNMWLSVGAETGLLGFAAFCAVMLPLILRLQQVTMSGPPAMVLRSGFELALLGAVIYPGLSGSFEDTRHVWVLIGMVAGLQRSTPSST